VSLETCGFDLVENEEEERRRIALGFGFTTEVQKHGTTDKKAQQTLVQWGKILRYREFGGAPIRIGRERVPGEERLGGSQHKKVR
jgi:hypothetical protein